MTSPKSLEAGIGSDGAHYSLSDSIESGHCGVSSPALSLNSPQKASNPNKKGAQYIEVHVNPHPGEPFFTSNIYKEGKVAPQPVKTASRSPYLEHVTRLSAKWPRLRYLAEFMENSTAPKRASLLPPSDLLRRQGVVNVGVVDFTDPHAITIQKCGNIGQLSKQLETAHGVSGRARRLFVVEDLSKPVIEALGSAFDIDPRFFRDHLEDHTWCNITDDWVELPTLRSRFQNRPFMTYRYMEPRFFDNEDQAQQGKERAGAWNVLRRLDFQGQVKSGINAWWEPSPRRVGLLRRKVSIWTKPDELGWTGVVLVDPPLLEGYPLWNGYGSLESPPSISSSATVQDTVGLSIFEAILRQVSMNSADEARELAADPESITSKVYPLIFGEILVTLQYAFTGLFQIHWGLDAERRQTPENLDWAINSLNKWQRRLPLLASYIAEGITCFEGRYALGMNIYSDYPLRHGPIQAITSPDCRDKWQAETWRDFISLLTKIDSLQQQADKIMALATTTMSAEENKRTQIESRNLSRITYLAFVFVPMSFVSSFLSMSNDLSSRSFAVYAVFFSVAIPMTLIALVIAVQWNKIFVWWESRENRTE